MCNQPNNLHPLYIEQQQWLAQFQPQQQPQQQQQQQQSQFAILQNMGFGDHRKNYRLLKRYNWNVDQVVQALSDKKEERQNYQEINVIQIINNTSILYIDCNNIKYACHQWNKFRGKPRKQVKTIFKIVIKWLQQEGQQLDEIHLIWDVYKMNKIEKFKHKLTKREPFQNIIDAKEEPNKFSFAVLIQEKHVTFSIQSAFPGIADDLIVNLCINHQDNSKTTVVTSDRGLKQRLQEKGVNQFIGNGKWWKLKEEMSQQCQQIQQQQQ